jgi:hypothetical protein
LASCYAAAVSDRQLLGAAPGAQTRKLGARVREFNSPDEALAEVGGINVHVGPAIDGRNRKRLERLCRYMTRPPVCQDRLSVTRDGRVEVGFKRAWKNGARAVVLDPLDFIARLVALIPRPRFNMTRYLGVLAPRAKIRSQVVPGRAAEQPEPVQLRLAFGVEAMPGSLETKPASRYPWAWLLQRVFAVDVMTCSRCQGRMGLVKIATEQDDIARVPGAREGRPWPEAAATPTTGLARSARTRLRRLSGTRHWRLHRKGASDRRLVGRRRCGTVV